MNKELTDPIKLIEQLQIMMKAQEKRYLAEIRILKEQVSYLTGKLYGSKSEKQPQQITDKQLLLFEESDISESDLEDADETDSEEEKPEAKRKRKKSGRKPLPENLPRVDLVHDLSEEDKQCNCGCVKTCCGEEVSEQLDVTPPKIQVIRNIRLKYACKCCEGVEDDGPTVMLAPLPAQLLPKSNASSGVLAHMLTAKFVDALPFYRQEKQFARIGIDISRTNMCNWTAKVAEKLEPLVSLIRGHIISGNFVNVDETTLQVLKEQGRAPTTKSYMWVYRGGPPDKPALIFQYERTRAAQSAKDFLRNFEGYVQTDGYKGYDFIDVKPQMHHVGCWAHARRKFIDASKAHKRISISKKKKTHASDEALEFIGKLYGIEQSASKEDLSFDELEILRREKSVPILKSFKIWLDKHAITVAPKSLLGKAISYTLGQWPRLYRFIKKGYITPDNNLAENAIRPFVLGRKNWLFSGTPKGAKSSAILYSLIETAKANGLEPYNYLKTIFDKIPHVKSHEDLEALLPWSQQ